MNKVGELLTQGATVLGPKSERLVSRVGGDAAQRKFHALAKRLWGEQPEETGLRQVGRGRLIWGHSAREFLQADGVAPDFEALNAERQADYEYIHYSLDGADFYFVCNQTEEIALRGSDLPCERPPARNFGIPPRVLSVRSVASPWSATRRRCPSLSSRTAACSSFSELRPMAVETRSRTSPAGRRCRLSPDRGRSRSIPNGVVRNNPSDSSTLTSWPDHSDPGIKYYSGKAVYGKTFDLEQVVAGGPLSLELGDVKDVGIARVILNDKDLGVVWLPPFRVDISHAVQDGENRLEVQVVNSWHNRVMGDDLLPADQRVTQTNIQVEKQGNFRWKLEDSGLLGPVRIVGPAD